MNPTFKLCFNIRRNSMNYYCNLKMINQVSILDLSRICNWYLLVEPNIGFILNAEVLSGPFQAHYVWCLELLVKHSIYLHRSTEVGLQEFRVILKDMGLYSLASDICRHGKLLDMCFSLWLLWEMGIFFPYEPIS